LIASSPSRKGQPAIARRFNAGYGFELQQVRRDG
jgi:hypothetical protein